MSTLRLILTVIYILDCVFLLVVVLMQEGKSQGLGANGPKTRAGRRKVSWLWLLRFRQYCLLFFQSF